MSDDRADRRRLAVTAAESESRRVREPDVPLIDDWLSITADGLIEIYTGKVEVGQNIRTSLAQVVAEELCVPLEAIHLVLADTDRTPFDFGTVGSQTTPIMARRLRIVAASTRELLLDRAASLWQVDRGMLSLDGGYVVERQTGRSIGFGELTQGHRLLDEWQDDVALTPAHAWTIAGTSPGNVAGRAVVTGQRHYTPDLPRPDLWAGKVLRPPTFGATLTSIDTHAATTMPNVYVVQDGEFVGVVASTRTAATEALAAIRAQWTTPEPFAAADLFDYLRHAPTPPSDGRSYALPAPEERGSVNGVWSTTDHVLADTYTHAYIAHAALEPRAAVAEWNDDHLTVWTGTQRPFGVRGELAQAFGISEAQIRVIVPDTGAGYGGKHTGEVAVEAARLAKLTRHAVKLIWTREEEFTWAYFRPAGLVDIRSAVHSDGTLIGWEFHNYNSGAAGMQTPYAVPHQRHIFHPREAPLRQGSYRALAATANNFARESHMDELALLVGMDPLAFRLHNLKDERMKAVLLAATQQFGWDQSPAEPDHGYGLACGTEKGSYVATCVEVRVEPAGDVRVIRAVQAFECGAIINPDGVRNQVEGALIQGLGGALFEAIEFGNGRILSDRFSRYRVPRFADIPAIETVLLDRPDLPSAGAGETPIIGIAPALGNAIFAASGVRLRELPLIPRGMLDELPQPNAVAKP